jgi:hypothetical protein
MIDAGPQGVLQARRLDWAGPTDLLGDLNTDSIAREEDGGRMIVAVAFSHPCAFHGY